MAKPSGTTIVIQISKAQLEVINQELQRTHEVLKSATDAGVTEWAKTRITEMQTQLLTFRDAEKHAKTAAVATGEPEADN